MAVMHAVFRILLLKAGKKKQSNFKTLLILWQTKREGNLSILDVFFFAFSPLRLSLKPCTALGWAMKGAEREGRNWAALSGPATLCLTTLVTWLRVTAQRIAPDHLCETTTAEIEYRLLCHFPALLPLWQHGSEQYTTPCASRVFFVVVTIHCNR